MQLKVLDKTQELGFVVYDGPSVFTGQSIIAIATGFQRVNNPKTGKMLQIWILDKNTPPLEALEEGSDENVCGSCKHRHFRSCYVNVANGPYQVYDSWRRGVYPKASAATLELFKDRLVRLGAYGDPGAVPVMVWDSILSVARGHTAYTHSWRRGGVQNHKKYCMASCDTLEEVEIALSRGWKPFYVRGEGEEVPESFFTCPASKEAGKRLDCASCLACRGGTHRAGQGVPTIIRHGPSWKVKFYDRGMKLYRQKKAYRSSGSQVAV